MTRPRYRKYPAIESELRKTRIQVMKMFGQDIPTTVKEVYRELYEMPPKAPVVDQEQDRKNRGPDTQGKQKRGYIDSDPTFEAAFAKGQAQRRKQFDRAIHMLTTGLEMHITDALKLLDDTKAKQDPEGMEPEKDVYQLVDKAAPTIGAFSQRQYDKLVRHRADRQEWLEGQDNWKAAGIE
jgi:hypothetical protein